MGSWGITRGFDAPKLLLSVTDAAPKQCQYSGFRVLSLQHGEDYVRW